ncbi:ankyrin-1-like [Trichogramma pretiosum]|uniref:ankyrin-1-like n=1 Tax=Trichogramma pretiosum TaxID=7493 RepID=UPI000C71B46E|nr:ankyrin-1-like [Trichogramma pretiosum]
MAHSEELKYSENTIPYKNIPSRNHKECCVRCKVFSMYNRFDVNYIANNGMTHLHVACHLGRVDIVRKCLIRGADPNIVSTIKGYSTLHFLLTAKCNSKTTLQRRQLFSLLMKSGANPNLTDDKGRTPLHVVCKKPAKSPVNSIHPSSDWFLAKMIFSLCHEKYKPVQVNARDREGNTPLHLALKTGNRIMVPWLLKNGADSSLPDPDGVVPKDIIRDEDLAKIFLEKCAVKPSSS